VTNPVAEGLFGRDAVYSAAARLHPGVDLNAVFSQTPAEIKQTNAIVAGADQSLRTSGAPSAFGPGVLARDLFGPALEETAPPINWGLYLGLGLGAAALVGLVVMLRRRA